MSWPCYVELAQSGELQRRADMAREALSECRICPRDCGVNRPAGETGFCGCDANTVVSSVGPHFGEEPPLVGFGGSGTIFFGGCNLRCIFCQNWELSWGKEGVVVSSERLAEAMLALQRLGCHNVNFVTPSHFVPQILAALAVAAGQGFRLPLVYNTGGYDRIETLCWLDGIFDIYMPDLKYMDGQVARELSTAPDYPEVATQAIAEMHRQVGNLDIDENGIARRGLLVRHLVMPEDKAGTKAAVEFLAGLSKDTYVNIMDQYRPMYRACEVKAIARRPTFEEYRQACRWACEAGLHRGFG